MKGGKLKYFPVAEEPKCTESTKGEQLPNERKFSELTSVEEKLEYVNAHRGDIPALLFAAKVGDDAVCNRLFDLSSYKSHIDNNGASVVHYAAMNTDYGVNVLDFFHRQGVDLSLQDEFDFDALSYALREGNIENALFLISKLSYEESLLEHCICERGVDSAKLVFEALTAKGLVGQFDVNLLYKAASHADLPMLQWLVQIGGVNDHDVFYNILLHSDKNATHGDEIANFVISNLLIWERPTFLARALKTGNCNVATKLLKKGVTLVANEEEKQAYMLLCVREDSLLLAKFVKGLGQPNVQFDESLLLLAFEFSSVEMCQWIIENAHANQPLYPNFNWLLATLKNKQHGSKILLEFSELFKSHVETFYQEGETPLHIALKYENIDAAEVLMTISSGARFDVTWKGRGLLQYCVEKNLLPGAIFLMRICGENPQLADGATILPVAAEFANVKMCQWLMTKLNFETATEMTKVSFLRRAVLNEAHGLEIIQRFIGQLDQEAYYKDDVDEENALHLALKFGKLDIAKFLLEHNESLIHEKCGGHNLLLFCVSANQLESAKFVFGLAKSMASGENGKTAMLIARNNGNEEMRQWLVCELHDLKTNDTESFDVAMSLRFKKFRLKYR
ncbi:uncharacterized protein LOC135943840 [Cloeon dipterum]|uniref:uncharacterized protein LOC135943840 n=1 Tax=Cloeon dipterum TaxID=197152 RepID=UPI003220126E